MAHRKTRLKLDHQNLRVNTEIRTKKLDPEALQEEPEIRRRDRRSGKRVTRQLYDKASGDPLADGYGYRWVTESGEEVSSEEIDFFVADEGDERAFSKHEPTLGRERTVTAETWIPVATIDEYLVEQVYECWAEDDTDVDDLYDLAIHIRNFDVAPVVPFVLQPSMYKKWGILTPVFYEDSFAMLIRVTARKIQPENRMPRTSPDEVKTVGEAEGDARPLEQESPFG